MVNAIPEYDKHPLVINGCSELFAQLWEKMELACGAQWAWVRSRIMWPLKLRPYLKLTNMTEENNWYKIDNISKLDSPALVVYTDRVKENIRALKKMIDDPKRLRPHIKTNKSRNVAELMIKNGIKKFKCATIAEAEMLGMAKAEDVLLAYQAVGQNC